MRTLARTLTRTGVLQVDSVNVLQRAHYMPLYSRMGPYDTDLLTRPRRVGRSGGWSSTGHTCRRSCRSSCGRRCGSDATSFRALRGKWWRNVSDATATALMARISDAGRPMTARDLDTGAPRSKEHWGWNWSEARRGLDMLYSSGELAIAGRTSQFEVRYDLPERVLPDRVLDAARPQHRRAAPRSRAPGRDRPRGGDRARA